MATKPNTTDVLDTVPDSSAAVAVRSRFELGTIDGDDNQALSVPWLRVTHGVGALAEHFNPGDWILGEDNFLVGRNKPMEIIVLSATQYWKEYMPKWDPNVLPHIFQTKEEVLENGGTVEWNRATNEGPSFSPAMHLKIFIKQPEGVVCGHFGIELDGEKFAVAQWDVDKSAYRRVGKVIITAAKMSLRARGLLSGRFTLTSTQASINNNIVTVPNIRLSGFNSDKVIEGIQELFASV